jgi:hypothetical protein
VAAEGLIVLNVIMTAEEAFGHREGNCLGTNIHIHHSGACRVIQTVIRGKVQRTYFASS